MIKIPQTLIEELVKKKVFDQEKLDFAIKQAQNENKDFGRVTVEQGLISDEDLLHLKSKIYNLPAFDLVKSKVDLNQGLPKEIPEDIVNFYQIIPFAKEGNVLRVGLINPEDLDALEALKFMAEDKGLSLEKFIISYRDFDRILKDYASITTEVGEVLQPIEEDGTAKNKNKLDIASTGSLEQITADSPITKVVAIVVKHAVENRASDIHIEPFEKIIRVRFRIDGILQATLSLPKTLLAAIVTRIKILSEMKIDETRLPQDGRFSTFLDRKIDFRVSTLPTRNGEKIVMRILDPMVGNIDLPALGFYGHSLEMVLRNLEKPFGELLVTGPTGSGKSTTLYALLRKYNNEGINVITLEDPIEYFLDGVNQSQIHEEIGYTFASGLRHILRQDPDVIMVGEIRDRETAGLATNAALTGHVVLSTLHTNDAVGVIPRLIDMGVEKYLIAPTVNLIIAQRLLRKLCSKCKIKAKVNEAEKDIIRQAVADLPKVYRQELPEDLDVVYKPAPPDLASAATSAKRTISCKECGGKSYKGRIAIFEILEMTDALEEIILGEFSEAKVRAEAKRQDMISMFQDGVIKVLKGITSLEELLEVAQESDEKEESVSEKTKPA
ncbi:MAG: type IV pilus assembly protein PilB [Parcubacteria group bacterium Gr01-1014_44]|nr:MAG: type IV pilus assembly protein PilB [Parcubacteria group bacterium Gr01-1014_44]